ncbi:extracellular calcium-sensing receptor-like isoform X1 [Erpetoichthys calabaricus]|uniref:extracellular calcium-sensing receptor-like isoform X1 n=1 Tax=Erpetoichthys calabaricus TaxID=27687 RepID=UPI002234870D|nr:extracellular calcium-sensing receptor-like isoform X1 [Erpetoichthys calabaricus]
MEGDVIIAGMFPLGKSNTVTDRHFTEAPTPVRCQGINVRTYRWLNTMIFAIKEINADPYILPNITLGYRIYDSCVVVPQGIDAIHWLVTGHDQMDLSYSCSNHTRLAAVITDGVLSTSFLLGVYSYPQINYFTKTQSLNKKREFPSFFTILPSVMSQGLGLARLVKFFSWTWVGILADDDDYGQGISTVFVQEAKALGICIEFIERIPIPYSEDLVRHIVENIKASTVKVIAVFSWEANLYPVMKEIERQDITGKVWIGSEGWSNSRVMSTNETFKILTGTVGFTIHIREMPVFIKYLLSLHPSKAPQDQFLRQFWEQEFKCKLPETNSSSHSVEETLYCKGNEEVAMMNNIFLDITNLRFTYNTYNAIYAVAYALHNLSTCKPGKGPFEGGSCASIKDFHAQQILHYVENLNTHSKDGEDIYFDENGNLPSIYDIVNWQLTTEGDIQYVKVGSFDYNMGLGNNLIVNESAIKWPAGKRERPISICTTSCLPGSRKAPIRGRPVCCFDCIPCSDGEISNETDATSCLRCPDDHWSNKRRNACIPKVVEFLSYEEPLGTTLASLSVLTSTVPSLILCVFMWHGDTPIVKANNRQLSYVLLCALTLCPLCSLIFIGKPSPASCLLRQTTFGIIFTLSVSCVLAKTIIVVIAFKASKPGSKLHKWVGSKLPNTIIFFTTLIQVGICSVWLLCAPPFPETNMKAQVGKIILECNEGSTLALWCMMGYMGILASISFLVAFLARKLPDSFNETKYITFSMLLFVSVWLSFVPAYLSTRGKYMVAVEIFAILSSSTGLLGCFFFPKCYIILIKPEKNTREFIMRKRSSSANREL